MTFRQTDGPAIAAAKASISLATAYRFEQDHRPPSSIDKVRTRRRPDPLADFFDAEVIPMLKAAPGLRAVAIFEEMRRRHPHLSPGRAANAPAAHSLMASKTWRGPGSDFPPGP